VAPPSLGRRAEAFEGSRSTLGGTVAHDTVAWAVNALNVDDAANAVPGWVDVEELEAAAEVDARLV
jgi:hypothetical protein